MHVDCLAAKAVRNYAAGSHNGVYIIGGLLDAVTGARMFRFAAAVERLLQVVFSSMAGISRNR
jgi:hypothetical protein